MSPHRIRRVLVANRGEIARRVIRGAHDAGLDVVAVYAEDDAASPYVGEADAAVLLPGTTLAQTYLSIEACIAAARRSDADALHPGYGFLSENADLAEACREAGITWVGPTPEAMRIMGHKARAKEKVSAAGVPVLPSAVLDSGLTEDQLLAAARTVDFPLLVKASAGGGGRGMRLVEASEDLVAAVAAAQREAVAAFGSDEVFLERFLRSPRHVEVQVVGDETGTVLHFFDRECSVQRRHQKVIEEAPAILVDPATRTGIWNAAVAAATAVGYQGVGTVEFLVDGDEFFFLEMNTRLQVEHGVTELVTGADLVGLQFSVAAGLPLPLAQADVAVSGHAIEARVCAERPREDYRPTPGAAAHVRWPSGSGIRVDAAIESDSRVSPSYDSLVAKVMAFGESRAAAIARLARALGTMELDALETNRDLLAAVLTDDDFILGDIGVGYLDARPDLRDARPSDDVRYRHAAAAAVALLAERADQSLVPVPSAGWRNVGVAQHVDEFSDGYGTLEIRSPSFDLPVSGRRGDQWVEIGQATVDRGTVDLLSGGVRRRYRVRLSVHGAEVNGPEGQSTFVRRGDDDPDARAGSAGECRAPLPGAIAKVLVAAGDVVAEGDALVVLEAMKMEHTLRASGGGTVSDVLCTVGQQVDVGDLLIEVTPA
jgi:acetyl/propionyl-CoA carboxylase alpha subunit